MKIDWLDDALDDIDDIIAHIATANPRASANVFARIEETGRQLSRFPRSGRPGRMPGTREIVVRGTPYLMPYRITADGVEILRVLHGKRAWPEDDDPPLA